MLRKKIDYYVLRLFKNIDGLCQLNLLGHIECVSMSNISTRLSSCLRFFYYYKKGCNSIVLFFGVFNLFYDNTIRQHEFTVVGHLIILACAVQHGL